MDYTFIPGGITAAKDFLAAGEHLGIRKNREKRDVALIVSRRRAAAACCYTQNLVKGAPIIATMENVADGYAQAVVCNSGNANTCNANGMEIARGMCLLVQEHTGIDFRDVVVASTGVIGQQMSLEPFEKGMGRLTAALEASPEGSAAAAQAIMTTDTVMKEVAVSFTLGGKRCALGGIAKGSGMICPNMATMLCFLTTDAAIAQDVLQHALSDVVQNTFNMLSVDGDTSTNDMVSLLANGAAGNPQITEISDPGFAVFEAALEAVCEKLCRMMAKDGEGATKLITCTVSEAATLETARACAKSVIKSPLVKAALFGADANWGRVLCALGYAGVPIDFSKIHLDFASPKGTLALCRGGAGIPFEEETAKEVLGEDEIDILVRLGSGQAAATAWGCDLTYDYVRINGDYRT